MCASENEPCKFRVERIIGSAPASISNFVVIRLRRQPRLPESFGFHRWTPQSFLFTIPATNLRPPDPDFRQTAAASSRDAVIQERNLRSTRGFQQRLPHPSGYNLGQEDRTRPSSKSFGPVEPFLPIKELRHRRRGGIPRRHRSACNQVMRSYQSKDLRINCIPVDLF